MYPSSDYYNHSPNPTSLCEQILPHMPLFISETASNPNSKLEDLHLASAFRFPSPFINHYEDFVNELTWQPLNDLFIHQQPFTPENSVVAEILNNMDDPKHAAAAAAAAAASAAAADALKQGFTHQKSARMPEQNTRKRSLKKDRHSKITTANGPRDRRMRLSLDVARKFFDLQDILGYDKASKTVEWLLIHANSAIEEIMRDLPRMKYERASVNGANTSVSSTTSECEVVSGIDDATTANDNGQQDSISVKMKVKSSCKKEKKAKQARRAALHLRVRESRKEARERAKKRTREKKLGETKLGLEAMKSDLKELGSWGHDFAGVEDSGRLGSCSSSKITPCTSLEGHRQVDDLISQEQREYVSGDSLVITGNWNPSSIFIYQQDAEVSHANQFSDFGYCGKTWEA